MTSTSPDYNRFVTIDDPEHPPPWFAKEKMRHNDFAYRWLVEIRHNSDPPVPNDGSAIFFHIRRGVDPPDGRLHDDGGERSRAPYHLAASRAPSLLRAFAPRRFTRRKPPPGACPRPNSSPRAKKS